MEVIVPKEFPLVLLACTILCLECWLIGFVVVVPARFKTFNKEHMEKFTEEHEAAFPGTKPAVGGWPDCGDGRYSDKLDYDKWYNFNNAMRVH